MVYTVYTTDMFFLNLIKTFAQWNVAYAVVGGYAVSLHGAVRATLDIDVVTELSLAGLQNMEAALHSLGLQSRLPVTAKDICMFRKEYIEQRNLIAWGFNNPQKPAEMVDVIITDDIQEIKISTVDVRGQAVAIAEIHSLIAMKKKSGRPQDIEDISALMRLL